jgi:spore maturation protein CgeB
MSGKPEKVLVLDGIGGVPLARDLCAAFTALGIATGYLDCLAQKRRPWHGLRAAYAKALDKRSDRDGFNVLPRLVERDLEALLEREAPSHILVVGFAYKFYDPAVLRRLADKCRAVLLLYDTDSCNLYSRRREFIYFVENELPVYDLIFSFSKVTTRFFRESRKLNAVFLPFGAKQLGALPDAEKSLDVLFVGTCDLRRIFVIEGIRDRVSIYGNRWQRNFPLMSDALRSRITDKTVWGDELLQLMGKSKIVLNITRSDFFGAETGVNLRIFEALAAGCFLLTDYCDELADLFAVGKEIETYRSAAELAEKADYYLNNKDARLAIARNGHAAFLANHTWQARIEQLLMPALDLNR